MVSSFCHRKPVRRSQFLIVSVIFHETSRENWRMLASLSLSLFLPFHSLFLSFSPFCLFHSRWFRGLLKMIAIRDNGAKLLLLFFFSPPPPPLFANFSDQSADRAWQRRGGGRGRKRGKENRGNLAARLSRGKTRGGSQKEGTLRRAISCLFPPHSPPLEIAHALLFLDEVQSRISQRAWLPFLDSRNFREIGDAFCKIIIVAPI